MLPFCFCNPVESELKADQNAYSENLVPLQIFSSFLINSHQRAVRKSLYGLTLYDPKVIDLSQLGDDVAGNIPFNPGVYDTDIGKIFTQLTDIPRTENNLAQIDLIGRLMQYLSLIHI